MGSRGHKLPGIGFKEYRWTSIGYVGKVKILTFKTMTPKTKMKLPEVSNRGATAYMCYRKSGAFQQLRIFGHDRMPIKDIDYNRHSGVWSLHVHEYHNGVRSDDPRPIRDWEFRTYKRLFKGVPKDARHRI